MANQRVFSLCLNQKTTGGGGAMEARGCEKDSPMLRVTVMMLSDIVESVTLLKDEA